MSSYDIAIKPVLIGSVALTDPSTAELLSPTQRIGDLKLTASSWTNSKESDTEDAELGLQTISLACYGDLTGFRIKPANGTSAPVLGTCV